MDFKEFFKESVVSIKKDRLDPNVFNMAESGDPILNQAIRKQIEMGIEEIKTLLMIKEVYIVGSILTKRYDKDSDIDVTVLAYEEDLVGEQGPIIAERLFALLRLINGHLAIGTTHPINYYVTHKFDEENFDGIYNLASDTWVKKPKESDFDEKKGFKRFEELVAKVDVQTGKLIRDIVDIRELEDVSKEGLLNLQGKLQRKVNEINLLVDELIAFRKDIKTKRNLAFDKPMTPEEIREYGSKNNLPENITYKLFQKYYYWNLINELENILKNRDDGTHYISKINKAIADMVENNESTTFENFWRLDERWDKMKMGTVDWLNPKSKGSYIKRKYRTNIPVRSKYVSQVPKGDLEKPGGVKLISISQKIVNTAKKHNSGIWRITPLQAQEIAQQYHFNLPNRKKPIKHLGSTGIILWRKDSQTYMLIKNKSLSHKI